MKGTPFSRALAIFAAIAAAMRNPMAAPREQLASIPVYESHGKGGKKPHRSVGTKAYQRAALKRRNVMKARHG